MILPVRVVLNLDQFFSNTSSSKFTNLFFVFFILSSTIGVAQQRDVFRSGMDRFKQLGNIGQGGGGDSLKRRDRNEDSITVRFRYLDSTRTYSIDSSINDFTKRFPIPA